MIKEFLQRTGREIKDELNRYYSSFINGMNSLYARAKLEEQAERTLKAQTSEEYWQESARFTNLKLDFQDKYPDENIWKAKRIIGEADINYSRNLSG